MKADKQPDGASSGRIQCFGNEPGISALAVRGFLSMRLAAEALAHLEEVLVPDASAQVVLIDVVDIVGFEPGVPAKLIQWLGARARRVPFAVLVTTSPVLTATVRAAELLLPVSALVACATRAEAVWTARQAARGRARVTTNLRQTSSVPPLALAPVRKQSA